ncbi:MAG: multidrug effflux MFS transporter [Myxococcales bacterium]|nr:multidrug effflux MFS transporter [Myxococcales bacterium]
MADSRQQTLSPSPAAPSSTLEGPIEFRMGFVEFVAFIAACMGINALSIDVMIPALPQIDAALSLASANDRQAVIIVYLLGMGLSQLAYGPLADRFGRRSTLNGGLVLFAVAGLISSLAPSFAVLLAARLLQGLGAGAPRVIAVSLARDRFRGPQMARVMSLALMVFMAIPVLAPSIGQLILLVAPWRAVFIVLFAAGCGLFLWSTLRLNETLRVDQRRALSYTSIVGGYREAARTKMTIVCTMVMGLGMGGLMSFVASAQQIFQTTYNVGRSFTLLFALIALAMSMGSFVNSRLVQRIGLLRVARLGLTAFALVGAIFYATAALGWLNLPSFVALQASLLFVFGFVGPNFNALAMEPMAHLAGTASSLIGAVTTVLSALLGFVIGRSFDGSILPYTAGNLVLALAAWSIFELSGLPRGPRSGG